MSEEERVAELEDAMTANDELMQKIEEENKELRELNTKLLAVLKDCMGWNPVTCREWEEVVAKAEKLKNERHAC
jgi:hypothetical protein